MEAQVRRPAPAHLDARDGWNLALLGAAFVASRLAWFAWNPESAVYWEESYRWLAAHEILTGPVQPLLDYQADHYQGGSLVMILLIVPFFLLFGESFLTFKLSALVVSTATLGALYVLGRAWFARPVGVLAALGYLAGPPLVAYWGVVPFGSHGESVFFSVAATGHPPLHYQWTHNGVILAGATEATLVLTGVQPSDAGGYEVIVTHETLLGTSGTHSRRALLTVE